MMLRDKLWVVGTAIASLFITNGCSADDGGGDRSNLDWATSNEIIGLNPDWVEQRLGVPKIKADNRLVFEINGCEVTYLVEVSSIRTMFVDVNETCHPNIQGSRITHETTFGSLDQPNNGNSDYIAWCLTSCGNAADPTIKLYYPRYKANGDISISYYTNWAQSDDAIEMWERSVRRHEGLSNFEYPPDYRIFRCVSNPPSEIGRLLSEMTVTEVWISRDDADGC